jgi:predicted acyltransferase
MAVQEVIRSSPQVSAPSARLFSLDVFRGATIAAMILVNNPGNERAYAPLNHATWNGWTPTDLVFPFFLFIVGVSLTLSFRSRLERGSSGRELLLHTLRRSAILFFIGLTLNGFPHFNVANWRVTGVLQRIALAYLAASVITLYFETRGIIAWTVTLLAGYWLLMRFVPVPGIGMPGSDMPINDPNANLSWYVDKLYLPGAMYEKTRDPEGILSTLPAIATALIGVLTGKWLAEPFSAEKKTGGMLLAGAAAIVAGEIWDFWFPINKKLWTSSFVLLTAGCALVALALCYWLCDVKLRRGWWTKPFLVFGSNAIAAYVLADLVSSLLYNWRVHSGHKVFTAQDYIYKAIFGGIASKPVESLLYSIAFVAICWLPIYWMYRKRIFLKI